MIDSAYCATWRERRAKYYEERSRRQAREAHIHACISGLLMGTVLVIPVTVIGFIVAHTLGMT